MTIDLQDLINKAIRTVDLTKTGVGHDELLSMVRTNNVAAIALYIGRGIGAADKGYCARVTHEVTFTAAYEGDPSNTIIFDAPTIDMLFGFSMEKEKEDSGSLIKALTNPVEKSKRLKEGLIEVTLTIVSIPHDRIKSGD